MKTLHDIIRARLLEPVEQAIGAGSGTAKLPGPEELRKTQWSSEFEELMHSRMVMGAYRYGTFDSHRKACRRYDSVASAIRRLRRYQETGNQELLVDAANLCMVEYILPAHDNPHFASEDDGEHSQQR